MPRLNCIILAAGKGTRMVSKIPKIMHPIMGKPMVRYVVERARQLNPGKVIVVTGHENALVEEALKDEEVLFCVQKKQKGTAHALLTAEKLLEGGDILVLYGDVPLMTAETLEGFRESFRHSEGISFMTTEVERPDGYGRVLIGDHDEILDIVEDSEATGTTRDVKVINTGICMIRADLLPLAKKIKADNSKGEYYLTDICRVAKSKGIKVKAYFHRHAHEVLGINTRKELLDANLIMRNRILDRHMQQGVTIADRSVYIESDVSIGKDTAILPCCYLTGTTSVGEDVTIGPHVVIRDSVVADGVTIDAFTVLDGARAEEGVRMGPFSRLRPKAHLKKNVHIGNFVEVKNSVIEEGSKANHLTYIGDAEVGRAVNIGAGTITCNYDGKQKHKTTIRDGVFVGSNTAFVAPVTIEKDAIIGAGATITRNVPEGALAISRTRQRNIKGYVRRKKCAE